jgi:cytochrome c553
VDNRQHFLKYTAAALSFALYVTAVPAAPPAAAALAASDAQLQEVLALTPDRQRGASLFNICAACHGAHGEGNASGWPPEIAAQHPRVIVKELVDFRTDVRWYDPMERIAGRHVLHTSQDIADVAAYAGALPAALATAPGSAKWLARGAQLYAERCQSCHGAHGEGSDERLVPRVAGQHYEYLLRQLDDCRAGRRPNMQSQHPQLLAGLDMEDLRGLADYMSRLGR